LIVLFFFSSRRRHTRFSRDWSSDVCSSDLGEMGYPSALTAKTWGFYDVLFKGNAFKFQRDYGSYVMEHILFKISFPAEFHAQTRSEERRVGKECRSGWSTHD